MTLTKYKQKRNLKRSGEPSVYARNNREAKTKKSERGHEQESKVKSSNKKLTFVIQKHSASHLHWDFRLEINGVLKSWAIPKEPPKVKGIKRLAIQVEDHPLEYAKFEGTIPEGNYGAGKVEIWDKGHYELIKKTSKEIEVKLDGKKLKGKYVLVKTHYGNKPEKSWLFMKV